LDATEVVGLKTNRDFLRAIAGHPAFMAADLDTGFIGRYEADLFAAPEMDRDEMLVLASLYVLARQGLDTATRAATSNDPASPWNLTNGWRMNDANHFDLLFDTGSEEVAVHVVQGRDGYAFDTGSGLVVAEARLAADDTLIARIDGRQVRASVAATGDSLTLFVRGVAERLTLVDPARPDDASAIATGSLTAPMPGKVIAVQVGVGDRVGAGDALVVMEAMKMEHTIRAPEAGTVAEIFFAAGDQVEDGAVLLALSDGDGK
ncbi:MAG: biotin/lipoyl-containing protein, partial [Rhodospirillales bacterium]